MLPVLRRSSFVDRMFEDFDRVFERAWSDSWPQIAHTTRSSSFASYEDNGNFYMNVSLPQNVDADAIRAEVREGTLTITIPKPEAKSVSIDVQESETIEGQAEEEKEE